MLPALAVGNLVVYFHNFSNNYMITITSCVFTLTNRRLPGWIINDFYILIIFCLLLCNLLGKLQYVSYHYDFCMAIFVLPVCKREIINLFCFHNMDEQE